MDERSPWHYVTLGQYQHAIDLYALLPPEQVTSITLNNRAAAYLCLRDYQAAAQDYTALSRKDPQSAGAYSGLAICHWCQGQPHEAVTLWRRGLAALYTDVAGVSLPGYLLYAGVRLGDDLLIREAKRLLRSRMRRKTVSAWPGAIAPYLLGKLTLIDFERAAYTGVTSAVLKQRYQCQFDFFRGVQGAQAGDVVAFHEGMSAAAHSAYGYLEDEYYLATWEVEQEFPDLRRSG